MRDPNGLRDKDVSAAATDRSSFTTAASCGIAFMAKASVPGRAKTRLVPPLTADEAAALNTAFLQDVADNVLLAARHAAPEAGIAAYAAYGPPGTEEFFRRTLPFAVGLIGAWLPDFGDCLLHTIRALFARGHAAAVVLNSDSPTLPTALLVETAAALAEPGDRVVLGPSSDGGYYLLGLKAAHVRLFEDIAWSTERVAAQTLARAREIGLDVHRLPVWYDVDDADALRRLRAELNGEDWRPRAPHAPAPYRPHHAHQTAKLLDRFWRQESFVHRVDRIEQVESLRA